MKTIKDIFSKIIKFILKITGDDLSIYAAQASFFIIISVIPFSMLVPVSYTHLDVYKRQPQHVVLIPVTPDGIDAW